ncbi:MAG TPA: hypothetical protein ENN60_01455 [archaeon]|nr:hypothetical protein [archaeon]
MANRVVLAGALTLVIFLSGLSVGMLWDSFRRARLESGLDEMAVYTTSLFLESQLIENASCDAVWPILIDAVVGIEESLDRYVAYTEASVTDLDKQQLLYRRYLLANIRYWQFVKTYRDKCEWNASVVLYFFNGDCGGACDAASTRLDYVKKKFGEQLLVFPINMQLAGSDPVAHTLHYLYNISSYPSMVINEQVYGLLSVEELEGVVCQRIGC